MSFSNPKPISFPRAAVQSVWGVETAYRSDHRREKLALREHEAANIVRAQGSRRLKAAGPAPPPMPQLKCLRYCATKSQPASLT